ncbi:MAG: hypothetical protein JXR56_02290, partial [Candidatus Cloacimonetes bacterium]|nr:hypothetical protein [Candidatus Cloacimonadota bacterium]
MQSDVGMLLRRVFLTVGLLQLICLVSGQGSWIMKYGEEGKTITKVTTVKQYHQNIFLGLEGFDHETNESFTRIQGFTLDGLPIEGFNQTYTGNPPQVGSGLFEALSFEKVITPVIEELDDGHFLFKWICSYAEQNYEYNDNYILPDSVETITEFPCSINKLYNRAFASYYFVVTGKAIINGSEMPFALSAFQFGEPFGYFKCYPNLHAITSVSTYNDHRLIVGITPDCRCKLIVEEDEDVWEFDFTSTSDSMQSVSTPQLISNCISYQDENLMLNIALYSEHNFEVIYTEQLESFVESIPILTLDDSFIFAYIKQNKQFIKRIDIDGNLIWENSL